MGLITNQPIKMSLSLSGLQTKIDSDFGDFRVKEELDTWVESFNEVVEYVKEKAESTILPNKN